MTAPSKHPATHSNVCDQQCALHRTHNGRTADTTHIDTLGFVHVLSGTISGRRTSTAGVRESSTAGVRESSTAGVRESSTAGVRESSTAGVRERGRLEFSYERLRTSLFNMRQLTSNITSIKFENNFTIF